MTTRNELIQDIFMADNALNRFRKMTYASSHSSAFADRGLTPTEVSTLIVLYDIGEASMNELAKYCGFTNSRITRAMDTLVAQNLALRYFKPNNRRTVYAAVTPLGANLVSTNNNNIFNRFNEVASAIPDKELNDVAKCYSVILDIFAKYSGLYKEAPYQQPTDPTAANRDQSADTNTATPNQPTDTNTSAPD